MSSDKVRSQASSRVAVIQSETHLSAFARLPKTPVPLSRQEALLPENLTEDTDVDNKSR